MAAIYFPSCNFTKASPRAAKRLREYMKERMPVAGCCRVDKTPYPAGDTALYFCQACRETLEAKEGNQLLLENHLPACWKSLEFTVEWRGARLAVRLSHEKGIELKHLGGKAITVLADTVPVALGPAEEDA